ncbi:MAG: dimethylargininase [Acidobacteria bacterium]|nr:dimethylargininase [Acidobacteriota bacterium]
MTAVAFVRGVSSSFEQCVTARPPDPPLNPELAATQHAQYVAALERGGYQVIAVPVDDDLADSSFIEDTAVVVGTRVLITRPGHPSRRHEVETVAAALTSRFPLHRVRRPAMIDGGDVLKMGSSIFVGRSDRTNEEGILAIAAIAEPLGMSVTSVPVARVLHLKSGVSALDDGTLLWHRDACEREVFDGFEVLEVEGDDPEAANVVRLADGGILVAEHHPETAALVTGKGFTVATTDVSEFARADGGLTCLSIRVR